MRIASHALIEEGICRHHGSMQALGGFLLVDGCRAEFGVRLEVAVDDLDLPAVEVGLDQELWRRVEIGGDDVGWLAIGSTVARPASLAALAALTSKISGAAQ